MPAAPRWFSRLLNSFTPSHGASESTHPVSFAATPPYRRRGEPPRQLRCPPSLSKEGRTTPSASLPPLLIEGDYILDKGGNMNQHLADRPVSDKRGYFARFFGFAFGVNGAGGLLNIARNRSSVRRSASSRGNNSSDLASAACCAADR